MLTLTAIAIFPIALVSYVIIRDEVRNVTRTIDFQVHDAAQSAQARFARSRDRQQVRAVAAASSARLRPRSAIVTRRPLSKSLARDDLLRSATYGRRLVVTPPNAPTRQPRRRHQLGRRCFARRGDPAGLSAGAANGVHSCTSIRAA
jgi:hypothetical protein